MSDTPPEPPMQPPGLPDRHHVEVLVCDGHNWFKRDLGIVRIRRDEVGLLFMDQDGEPFISVIPECESSA